MSSDPVARTPDPATLEQVLRLTETVLLDGAATDVGVRICQVAAHAIGVSAVRLVMPGEAPPRLVAAYGAAPFPDAAADVLARVRDEGRPALHEDADGTCILTVPLGRDVTSTVMQLRHVDGATFSLEQIATARYVAALAVVALRQAAARTKLARAVETRSEILIALAHDLRTPLSAVLGYTQLLMEGEYGRCTDTQRGVLSGIEQQALQLLAMLNDALAMARADAEHDEPRRDEFALDEVLRELCSGASARRATNGVRLVWSVDPAVPPLRSDRFRVRQILQNLVDNALRFTDHGDVNVDARPHEGGIRVVVSDTGTGIDRADLPYLFEPFRPGGSARSGTGCGLYLVKRFSESLGGRIAVDSTPGIGTRFTIDLPVSA
jgi:signal transduction histidine kinase